MNRYIISGKAASGKDWLQREMIKKGYAPMRQYTTREKRDYETDEYHFVDIDTYKSLEPGFVSSNFYRIGWYGISYDELMNSDVAILSPANVRDIFEKHPDIRDKFTVIYLDIPVSVRRERLSKRYGNKVGDDNEIRIENDERDFMNFNSWDIKLGSKEEVDEYINNLPPKLKNNNLFCG